MGQVNTSYTITKQDYIICGHGHIQDGTPWSTAPAGMTLNIVPMLNTYVMVRMGERALESFATQCLVDTSLYDAVAERRDKYSFISFNQGDQYPDVNISHASQLLAVMQRLGLQNHPNIIMPQQGQCISLSALLQQNAGRIPKGSRVYVICCAPVDARAAHYVDLT